MVSCQIETAAKTPACIAADPREIDSRSLLRGARMIVIRHRLDAHCLSQTASGKLILTK